MGLPKGVHCADGGTGGMDVAFQMRGVPEVILVDACSSGSEPGALFRLSGADVENPPPPGGFNLHSFRWDHALSFGRWLLKDEYPRNITVYLIEGASYNLGDPLSPLVDRATKKLAAQLYGDITKPGEGAAKRVEVEITDQGSLHLSNLVADTYFSTGTLLVQVKTPEMWLLPTRGPGGGGLLLKRRNAAGDRSVLISEHLPDNFVPGAHLAFWDEAQGALRVALATHQRGLVRIES
jgi:hydrogenase maturation protease